jgi:hypothetical protein
LISAYSYDKPYLWNTHETTATITATADGTYTVTVTDANGCSSTASINAVIVATKNSKADAVYRIYPNPTTGHLAVESALSNTTELILTNVLGQLLESQKPASNRTEFDLSNYPSGIYFIKISMVQGEITKKVVLQK